MRIPARTENTASGTIAKRTTTPTMLATPAMRDARRGFGASDSCTVQRARGRIRTRPHRLDPLTNPRPLTQRSEGWQGRRGGALLIRWRCADLAQYRPRVSLQGEIAERNDSDGVFLGVDDQNAPNRLVAHHLNRAIDVVFRFERR